jgi:3-mercaptopyruvate sulfurtransferase SseA
MASMARARRAADILSTLNHPDVRQLLVGRRGWSAEDYEGWCAEMAVAELLDKRL